MQSIHFCSDASRRTYYGEKRQECLNSLLSYQKDLRYQKFDQFFKELPSLTLDKTPINVFQGFVIRNLIPIAPYMMKLIKLSKRDIDWLAETGFAGAEEELRADSDSGSSEEEL